MQNKKSAKKNCLDYFFHAKCFKNIEEQFLFSIPFHCVNRGSLTHAFSLSPLSRPPARIHARHTIGQKIIAELPVVFHSARLSGVLVARRG